MTNGQADALGCAIWAVAGIAGIVVGVLCGSQAASWFPNWPKLAWVVGFLVGSSAGTPLIWTILLAVCAPLLRGRS